MGLMWAEGSTSNEHSNTESKAATTNGPPPLEENEETRASYVSQVDDNLEQKDSVKEHQPR